MVSAKEDKKGIDSLFDEVLNEYIKSSRNKDSDSQDASLKIEQKKAKKREARGCCN